MKLVKFDDGLYGVRTFWLFGWHFRDLRDMVSDREPGTILFKCCKGTKEMALKLIDDCKECATYTVVDDHK